MIRRFAAPCMAALVLAASACSSNWVPGMLRPYRPDVQQGNVVTKDMVDQLRPGMTRDQVRFLLGTPMLTDIFHQDRWDYPYYLHRRNGETQIRKLSVVFADGKLARFESDAMPAEPLADSLILGTKINAPAAPAPASAPPQDSAPPPSAPPQNSAPPASTPPQDSAPPAK